jgi:hypothetical protein
LLGVVTVIEATSIPQTQFDAVITVLASLNQCIVLSVFQVGIYLRESV